MAKSKNSKKKLVPSKKSRINKQLGLLIPIKYLNKLMKSKRYGEDISRKALIFLSAAMEYLIAELLDVCVVYNNLNNIPKISPKNILKAIQQDLELSIFFKGKSICWTNKDEEVEMMSIDGNSKAKFLNKLLFTKDESKIEKENLSQINHNSQESQTSNNSQ